MLKQDTVEFYLSTLERKDHRGNMLAVDGVLGLIAIARYAMADPKNEVLVLTECDRCCSDGASYRLFSGIPDMSDYGYKTAHPDTSGRNLDMMICKCYSEPEGLAERVARIISPDARRLKPEDGIPKNGIAYLLKGETGSR